MGVLRERLRNFMRGRYGVDALSKVLIGITFLLVGLSLFFGKWFYVPGVCLLIYVYFRMLSTNYEKRYKENRAFINLKNRIWAWGRREKNRMQIRRTHHIYTCTKCKQKIRIPKGHGKIMVTCPKCKFEFVKRS